LRINVNAFQRRLDAAEKRRNLLAHSAWMKGDAGNVILQATRGVYQAPRGQGKSHRTLYPEGLKVDAAFRRESIRMVTSYLRDLKRLSRRTDRLVK
jgi:hypothetical protein